MRQRGLPVVHSRRDLHLPTGTCAIRVVEINTARAAILVRDPSVPGSARCGG